MSFRPLSLTVFFPPEPEPESLLETRQDSQDSMDEQDCLQLRVNTLFALDRTVSHESKPAVTSSTNDQTSIARTQDGRPSDTWNDTGTAEISGVDEGYWEYQGEDDEQNAAGSPSPHAASQHVWMSDEEKMRVAFRRARASAQRADLDRSPFFPQTLAEYVGLKAEAVEDKAARLRAWVEAREGMLRAREKQGTKSVFVLGACGRIEEKIVLVCHGEGGPRSEVLARSTGGVRKGKGKGKGVDAQPAKREARPLSVVNLGNGWSEAAGPTINGIDAAGPWGYPVQPPFLACQIPTGWNPLNAKGLTFGGYGGLPVLEENCAWHFTDAACIVPHAKDAASYHNDFTSRFNHGSGHQRARSAEFLRQIVSHAALRRGLLQEEGGPKPEKTGNSHCWFEDDAYDSDSSFTPSEYSPKKREEECHDYRMVRNYTTQLASPFTMAGTGWESQVVSDAQASINGIVHGSFNQHRGNDEANNESSDSEATRFPPSDYTFDRPKFYMTLDGKLELKGKEKAADVHSHVQGHAEPESTQPNADEAVSDTSDRCGRPDCSSLGDKNKTNEDNESNQAEKHSTPVKPNHTAPDRSSTSTPSSSSTFTPSNYNPRKLAPNTWTQTQNWTKLQLKPPSSSPLDPPALATLPLTHRDGHSAVLARPNNPFTPASPENHSPPACDWPTTAELTSEGDSRIKRCDPVTSTTSSSASPSSGYYSHAYTYSDYFSIDDLNNQYHHHHHHHFFPDTYPPDNTCTYPPDTPTPTIPTPEETTTIGVTLGRFLPVPRLRNELDARLGLDLGLALAPHDTDALTLLLARGCDSSGSGGAGLLPWEVRRMVGERWDLHADRRIWEVWRVRFGDEEEGARPRVLARWLAMTKGQTSGPYF
ncbi:hypothetical protein N658DRAFT_534164 [Parathielavia hyrcaniae]|uniref:Uncharacterized protein n=1 Tax=Parathielavia hyrcaniae TaxID=113614 RepID=A0AAN6Q2J9_9PEZI|nr:hypothetical protein N658DRAFT_534164 [Parathielavia hyrcaniae]